jgi:hydroxylysine kinase
MLLRSDSDLPIDGFLNVLSAGIIHGDFNEQNILVQPVAGSEPPTYEIAGIIDFGDMSENYYVLELAMTIMYMTIESKVIDPMLAGGHVLAGYTAVKPISDVEFNALKTCVAGRFIQSLVMGAYTYLMDPGNDYVLTTAARGWSILRQLWETPSEQLYANWRQVMQSYT